MTESYPPRGRYARPIPSNADCNVATPLARFSHDERTSLASLFLSVSRFKVERRGN